MDWLDYSQFVTAGRWPKYGRKLSAIAECQLVPFLHFTTMKGDAAMESSMLKKPESVEYAAAHPFCIPLWVALLAWLVEVFSVGWFWLIPTCFLLLWLTGYLYSAPRLFAYYGRQESITSIQKPEVAGVATGRTVL